MFYNIYFGSSLVFRNKISQNDEMLQRGTMEVNVAIFGAEM